MCASTRYPVVGGIDFCRVCQNVGLRAFYTAVKQCIETSSQTTTADPWYPTPAVTVSLYTILLPVSLNAPARIQHLYRYHRIPTYCLKVLMRRRQCECIIICHVFTTLKLVECVYGLFDLQVQASSNLVAVLLRDTPQSCWWSETKTFRSFGPPLGQF